MKSIFKKAISLSLVLVILISMLSTAGLTVSAATYSGTCGDNLTWTMDANGTITISGTGAMYSYRNTSAPWDNTGVTIRRIIIEEGVTDIGRNAFGAIYGSVWLIVIPSTLESIGSEAFMCGARCVVINSESIAMNATSYDALGYLLFHTHSVLVKENFSYGGYISSIGTYLYDADLNGTQYKMISDCSSHCYKKDNSLGVELLLCDYCYAITEFTEKCFDVSIAGDNTVTAKLYKNGDDIILKISGNGDIRSSDLPWRYFNDLITHVEIDYGITSIPNAAFYYHTNLRNVTIPESVISIGWMAFENCESLVEVVIPSSVISIDKYAFFGCVNLLSVIIPYSVTSIGEHAFECYSDGSYYEDVIIKCYENSYAHTYAVSNEFKYELLVCEHTFTTYISDKIATCTEDATKISYCDNGCGITDILIIDDTAVGHTWSNWTIDLDPTETNEGEKSKYCTVCGVTETEKIPKLVVPYISTKNYTVYITNADYFEAVRYAIGVHSTASSIKNAADRVDLSSSVIAKNMSGGNFVYEMLNGGYYTFWVKMTDGKEYLLAADMTEMHQEIVTDGVTMTVKNLYGVKDYFIAKGEYTTYAEVKANSVVQITKNKIGTKHDYTYILSEPGVYTVCVRYDDTTRAHEFITVELTVNEPTFTENGLQLKVGNLEGVRVIRTAYGEYNTPGEIKRAEGARAFTGKTVLKGLSEYAIQYRNEGLVTVAVVYNNGYEVMYTYNVIKKTPEMIQEGSTVTFTSLDDLKVIRYAEGTYTTSNQIKNAPGSMSIQGYKIDSESYSVTLDPGIYTFCVQYNDESYNYYVVTVEQIKTGHKIIIF